MVLGKNFPRETDNFKSTNMDKMSIQKQMLRAKCLTGKMSYPNWESVEGACFGTSANRARLAT